MCLKLRSLFLCIGSFLHGFVGLSVVEGLLRLGASGCSEDVKSRCSGNSTALGCVVSMAAGKHDMKPASSGPGGSSGGRSCEGSFARAAASELGSARRC